MISLKFLARQPAIIASVAFIENGSCAQKWLQVQTPPHIIGSLPIARWRSIQFL